jgi:hypothetical protein
LQNNPRYEALSYVWGDSADALEISVNGNRFRVTRSVHDILKAVRSPTSKQTFWVDQVCINQKEDHEKNHQVQMMGDIYQAATGVLVYLGQPTEQTENDMQHLQSLLRSHVQGEDAPWSHIAVPELKRSVSNILASHWFERMWTVQEAVLARNTTLQCGPHRISWAGNLQTLRALVFRIKSAVVSPVFNLHERDLSELDWTPLLYILESQMRQAARREGVILHRNLLDVAFDFRHRRSYDLRDRYYAILGIIENDQGGSLYFKVDYSVPVEEVYKRFRAEIQRIGEIEDVPLVRNGDI